MPCAVQHVFALVRNIVSRDDLLSERNWPFSRGASRCTRAAAVLSVALAITC